MPNNIQILNQPKVYQIKALCVVSYIVTDGNKWKDLRQETFICEGKEDMQVKLKSIIDGVEREGKGIDPKEVIIDLVDPTLIKEVFNSYASKN